MPSIVPPTPPLISREEALGYLASAGIAAPTKAVLFARRGHFVDFGGDPKRNDFGVFDDAIVLISPTAFVCYNANTDPSIRRPKVAVLQAGTWRYRIGTHNRSKPMEKRYTALIQDSEVDVFRPETEAEPVGAASALGRHRGAGVWRGWFGVNIHRGGLTTTGSEGCQTIYKPQWDAFIETVRVEMKRHGQDVILYHLTEAQ
jgi:hypothetical protein